MELFGDCLDSLLRRTGTRVSTVAEAVDVDPSLVYRWMRNDRVPAKASYVEKVIDVLTLAPEDEEALRRAFLASQQLGSTRLPKRRKRSNPAFGLLHLLGLGMPACRFRVLSETKPFALPSTLEDQWSLLPTLRRFLSNLPLPPTEGARILTTYAPGGGDSSESTRIWNLILEDVLSRGWNVDHLVKIEPGPAKSAQSIKNMLRFLGSRGEYRPFALSMPDQVAVDHQLIVVPGSIAIVFVVSPLGKSSPVAMAIHDQFQIDLLERHVLSLLTSSKPLITTFTTGPWSREFQASLADSPTWGDQALLQPSLPALTEPVWSRRNESAWLASAPSNYDLAQLRLDRERRLANFYKSTNYFRAITSREAVKQLVQRGTVGQKLGSADSTHQLTLEQRRAWLQNLIDLLSQVNRLELALVDYGTSEKVFTTPFWMVAGQSKVLFEIENKRNDDGVDGVALQVNEANIAQNFQDAFHETWSNLPHSQRNKTDVIAWLQGVAAGQTD